MAAKPSLCPTPTSCAVKGVAGCVTRLGFQSWLFGKSCHLLVPQSSHLLNVDNGFVPFFEISQERHYRHAKYDYSMVHCTV